jgi:hypothetical protein
MKTRIRILFLLAAVLPLHVTASAAQGHLVRHGFDVTMPAFEAGPDGSYVAFAAGYHLAGIAEARLGIERRSDYDMDVVTVSLSPGVAFYPIRQASGRPATLRIGLTYEEQALQGDPIVELERQGLLSDGYAWRLELGLSRRFPWRRRLLGRPAELVPIVNVFYRDVMTRQGTEQFGKAHFSATFDVLVVLDAGGLAHVASGPRMAMLETGFAAGWTLSVIAGRPY